MPVHAEGAVRSYHRLSAPQEGCSHVIFLAVAVRPTSLILLLGLTRINCAIKDKQLQYSLQLSDQLINFEMSPPDGTSLYFEMLLLGGNYKTRECPAPVSVLPPYPPHPYLPTHSRSEPRFLPA